MRRTRGVEVADLMLIEVGHCELPLSAPPAPSLIACQLARLTCCALHAAARANSSCMLAACVERSWPESLRQFEALAAASAAKRANREKKIEHVLRCRARSSRVALSISHAARGRRGGRDRAALRTRITEYLMERIIGCCRRCPRGCCYRNVQACSSGCTSCSLPAARTVHALTCRAGPPRRPRSFARSRRHSSLSCRWWRRRRVHRSPISALYRLLCHLFYHLRALSRRWAVRHRKASALQSYPPCSSFCSVDALQHSCTVASAPHASKWHQCPPRLLPPRPWLLRRRTSILSVGGAQRSQLSQARNTILWRLPTLKRCAYLT